MKRGLQWCNLIEITTSFARSITEKRVCVFVREIERKLGVFVWFVTTGTRKH